ncbi:helix-turn-helix domain-containing protein [Paraferrimonas sp. SM1919]|uniref:helix-turn-helix domain-containing protein n=1 Tax=Paraferrimonas sp. SM1919 TaxID=2662263 RepID=UPI0013D52337|nr:helix-turn-helix transcriptional regulator [Paraferrimonas sp. SM1919]
MTQETQSKAIDKEQGKQDVSKALSALRLKSKLSQEKLAQQIGISDRYIRNVESGKSMPSFDIVRRWFNATKASQKTILSIVQMQKLN